MVHPTYAAAIAARNRKTLRKNHAQLLRFFFAFREALDDRLSFAGSRLLEPELEPELTGLYKLWACMLTMSWLSLSSPVPAEKPR